ncbi:putative programmed cell death protein 6 [Podospora australis]|uniref:Programmed cell death protein 6 n=1 Tax=Podospora australis TaxID=1536484 RepID=A0AAN7APA3_9PEZI|nr:putative programmed cell death protein 6 [Podospora australis]
MAYNRNYNPDELPRFAEPEQKGPKSPLSGQPPSSSSYSSRYENKPPPPRPIEHKSSSYDRYGAPDPGSARLSPRHAPPPDRYGGMSPPPSASGSRPVQQTRPPASSRPPPSPAPRDGAADPTLLPLFRAVDKDGTGQLSEKELSAALVNGDWTAFDPQTVRMMIRMFDSDRSGTIGFEEFCGLWSFLASWRTLFDRFDADRSGNISLDEFNNALVAFRYRLSERFVEVLFRTYDKRGEGVMSFDLFVQACISLKRMTDVFKKYDEDRDGYITLSFEDFLTEILRQLR